VRARPRSRPVPASAALRPLLRADRGRWRWAARRRRGATAWPRATQTPPRPTRPRPRHRLPLRAARVRGDDRPIRGCAGGSSSLAIVGADVCVCAACREHAGVGRRMAAARCTHWWSSARVPRASLRNPLCLRRLRTPLTRVPQPAEGGAGAWRRSGAPSGGAPEQQQAPPAAGDGAGRVRAFPRDRAWTWADMRDSGGALAAMQRRPHRVARATAGRQHGLRAGDLQRLASTEKPRIHQYNFPFT
jgi:hypothetical protein